MERPGPPARGALEPTVLLTALAGVANHIGLIATASTVRRPAPVGDRVAMALPLWTSTAGLMMCIWPPLPPLLPDSAP